ncbi:MAG: polysaccharide pyruvyl transferase family protein, partial [Eggerthellales bacterium]|nr:polysaccharide pyruvyl transferase family protein [Eggerthellales bacterium]
MGIASKIKNNLGRFKMKNRFILTDETRPASSTRVNYEWWASKDLKDNNIGDYLAPLINDWMLSKEGIENHVDKGPVFLASVGSVLGLSLNDCTVWGSGLLSDQISPTINPSHKKMDIRAVRGPNTKAFLESRGYQCPDVFGDPAMLMPLLYPAEPREKKGPVVIKHYRATQDVPDNLRHLDILTSDYKGFIHELLASTLVISSSLHGIILAESYGVPAVLLNDNRVGFSLFKYEDWYFSTGRSTFPVVTS